MNIYKYIIFMCINSYLYSVPGGLSGEWCLKGPGSLPKPLWKYLWGQGPTLWPLKHMLTEVCHLII